MELREIHEEEIHQMKALRNYAFRFPPGGGEDDFLYWANHSLRLGVFDGENLAAQVLTYPLAVSVFGQKYQMGGVAYVASYPEYRRGGLIRKLMTESIRQMKERGQVVSYLRPFSIPFYRKFGYELFTEELHVKLTKEHIQTANVTGKVIRTSHHNDDTFPLVKSIYQAFAQKEHGVLIRDDAFWLRLKRRKYTDEVAVYLAEDGEPLGYIMFTFNEEVMKISEMIALKYEAEQALWQFIRSHDSMFTHVEAKYVGSLREVAVAITDPTDMPLTEVLSFMMRVVDVEAFLKDYPYCGQVTQDIVLEITDETAPWNNGTYIISSFGSKKAEVNAQTERLKMDIGTFSQTMMGFIRPEKQHYYHKIIGDITLIQQLEQIIPRQEAKFLDNF